MLMTRVDSAVITNAGRGTSGTRLWYAYSARTVTVMPRPLSPGVPSGFSHSGKTSTPVPRTPKADDLTRAVTLSPAVSQGTLFGAAGPVEQPSVLAPFTIA